MALGPELHEKDAHLDRHDHAREDGREVHDRERAPPDLLELLEEQCPFDPADAACHDVAAEQCHPADGLEEAAKFS